MKLQYLFLAAISIAACGSSAKETEKKNLVSPSELRVTVNADDAEATLSWKDNASGETGYYVFKDNGNAPYQTLPENSESYTFRDLTPGKSYTFGVQAYGDMVFSKLVWAETASIPEPDPNPIDAVTFTWTEVTGLGLPASVKIYKTEDKLNGRNFNAWYAVASTKDVDFKVLYPGAKNYKTIDTQAQEAGNCLVLVNGGIFGGSGKPNGLAVCDGVQTPWFRVEDDNWDVDRQYWGPDSRLHTVSRAMMGVDADGVPGVYWSYTPSHGTVYVYEEPIPSVAGESVKQGGTDTYPCKRSEWEPYNAITCGPMLLINGRCPINDKKSAKGYWETNYEMWADDIYGVDQRADRTAAGYLEDGRIILLVADGRITASQGATTLEMASIMKGLGCVGAINLDGGGSTGMWAGGSHLNDQTGGNRKILTTIGFFSK